MVEFVKKVNYVWEQRKLGEIYGSIGNAFVGTATPYYVEQGHFYLESNNVKDGQINHNSEIFINDEFYEKQKDKWLHTGDMVMVQSGHVGHAAVIPEELDNTAAHALIMFRNPKEKIEPYFLNYEYQTNKAKKKIENITTGNTIKHILASDMQEFVVDVPKYEEQKVIADYFSNLDHLITLHQRKIYIFIKNLPIDWEQRKLGEIAPLRGGYAFQSNNFLEEGIPIVKISNILSTGEVAGEFSFYEELDNDTNFILPDKAAVLAMSGATTGKVSILSNPSNIKFYQNQRVGYFKKTDGINYPFISTLVRSQVFNNQLNSILVTGAQPNVSSKDIDDFDVLIPTSYKEQKKIGAYFSNLDHLITLHHRKCVVLRKMKVNDWEQRKFIDIATRGSSVCTSASDIPSVEYEDVVAEEGRLNKDIRSKEAVKSGITFDGSQVLYGKLRPYLHNWLNPDFKGVAVGDWWVLKPINVDKNFLYRLIQTQQFDNIANQSSGSKMPRADWNLISNSEFMVPLSKKEQSKIGRYFDNLDHLITLHHRECVILRKMKVNDWEQRKLNEVAEFNPKSDLPESFEYVDLESVVGTEMVSHRTESKETAPSRAQRLAQTGDVFFQTVRPYQRNNYLFTKPDNNYVFSTGYAHMRPKIDAEFLMCFLQTDSFVKVVLDNCTGTSYPAINSNDLSNLEIDLPTSEDEQRRIGCFITNLDHLITLHHHEEFCTENVLIYIEINKTIQIKEDIMAELESVIEQKLIDQLVYGDSQWTYRADLKTEEDLWNNFRYILEQNNKDRLNGEPLSDTEFEQVKNQLQFSSFYKAGEWLVGENGKVMVHVQRDTERLHLVVMNHEHIAGGSSVYEVINQYRALADEESQTKAQDRRFDVTLMINGLPMIHIELKNKQHSYMDGFWQIKKYIGEGKFTGIFSAVQMFVISNGVDTKYFSAASDTELNPKFISGWLDNENNPVPDYLDFAKSVLRIPEAHEMIARYTVLDEEAKRLILLRPYQIHAIEAIREASKTGKSGFVWHTTGSGKTLTSYKATRNLLMDIPSIDKAIFLIDRKDLDTQTSMAFQTYANNDLVDVDQTDNVFDLKKKLKSDDRQMIVTTIQKLQRLITKKLAEGTPEYNKIKNLKIAFVVDECHRAVTPGTKRELERFFANSLWYGFTGTPRFAENPYPQLGDLPRTTEELYGERLHRYTIQNAIHDNAVLGFQVEHNGPKNMDDETDSSMYENETHMLRVLDVILNKSYHKLGFQNGKGKTYEGLLTTSSIQLAQKYYELLKRVKNGETELQIDEKVKQILPDFPKFAITYSVTENEEGSHLNQEKMKESINDYNEMFGTKLDISQIQSYNANLNKRLARKEPKFQSRSEQLDLVIVVDRLLTGFDAPCMSTLFVDRQPMGPHDLIQAFSRTNRIFDKNKTYGQIVTFQAPKLFKECVDNAVKLYSAGSTEIALLAEWEEIEPAFRKALKALRVSAETPAEIPAMSEKEKVLFVKAFQNFDKLFAQLKSFTQYEDSMLTEYGISEDEYDDYAGHYLNVKEELKAGAEDTQSEMEEQPIDVDYELMAYSNTKIDYEYIINLIQNIVTPDEDVEMTPEERQKQLEEVKQYIDDLRKENPKVADIMSTLVSEIEQDEVKYKGQSILNIVENMKHECIEKVVMDFSITWYVSKDDVMYAATHYRNGEIPNESAIKSTADFTSFKEAQERAIPKFKYYNMMIEELRKTLEEEIKPLLNN